MSRTETVDRRAPGTWRALAGRGRPAGRYLAVIAVAVVWAAVLASSGDAYYIQLSISIGIYALLAISLDFVMGYAGQFTLGHPGLYALGAYVSGILSTRYGWSLAVAGLVGILAAAAAGLGIGFASLRISGLYLALVTLGFSSLVAGVLVNWQSMTGGDIGIAGIPAPSFFGHSFDQRESMILVITCAALAFLLLSNILRSRPGRALVALRQSEVASRSLGIAVLRYKLVAFTLSSALVGLAGVLYAATFSYLSPQTFGFGLAIQIVLMVVFGGLATLVGPVIGAAALVLVPEYLKGFAKYNALAYGVVLLLIVLFVPRGIIGTLRGLVARLGRRPNEATADAGEGAPVVVAEPEPSLPMRRRSEVELLVVDGIERRFDGVKALDGVTFSVAEGSRHGLIGPNGSGKTTLLNIISGYYSADAGDIRYKGESILGKSPERIAGRGLVRTFQNLQLFPQSSVLENVMVGCHRNFHSGMVAGVFRSPRHRREEREIEERAFECLRLVGLAPLARVEARGLPYGQQKLVDVARALAAEPEVLLLDEPVAGLHADERSRVRSVLERLSDSGLTLLIVEHNLDVVMALCDEVTVLQEGRRIASAEPERVTADLAVRRAYLGEEAPA